MSQFKCKEELYKILCSSHEEFDLAHTALLLAEIWSSEVDVDEDLFRINLLADGVAHRLSDEDNALFDVNVLSEYLFDEKGFQGNQENYYDPKNSFLNEVLKTHKGNPITLSVLYMEVGRRVGMPLEGVSMPGHFLVRHNGIDALLIDPFQKGIMIDEEECKIKLANIANGEVPWDANYLKSVGKRQIIARILRNLKSSYMGQGNYNVALEVSDCLLLMFPEHDFHIRDRGLINYYLGNFRDALRDLQQYMNSPVSRDDSRLVANIIRRIHKSYLKF